MSNASSCHECGYCLRGLPARQPCPECGHHQRDGSDDATPSRAWARCVFAGLALLLALTMTAVASVLVQPFHEIGGTAPSLNLPGPKLWAMPLLQRPIGRSPQLPGVIGTRVAMLSLLAVWLTTTPYAGTRRADDGALRLATRWTSVVLFGFAFGALMAAQGLWPSELPPFRLLLVGGVELPCAILLYLYLRRLSDHVPGRARRELFARLTWLVPIVIAGAAAALTVQWLETPDRIGLARRTIMIGGVVYGALAVTVGVAATAAVGGLCFAYFHHAFPLARRWITGGRYLTRGVRQASRRLTPARLQLLAVAAGAILLIVTMALGIDRAQWIATRDGIGGNMPFVNFPGPKFWATAAMMHFGSRSYWDLLASRSTILCLNLAAIWLITAQTQIAPVLRRAVRWAPVVALGLTFAVVTATRNGHELGVNFQGAYYSRFFVIVAALGETPATLLLYWWLSRVAAELNLPRLAWSFRRLAVVIFALVALSFGMFVISRPLMGARGLPEILFLASIYAVVAIAAAAWAVSSLAGLAAAAFMRGCGDEEPTPVPRLASEKPRATFAAIDARAHEDLEAVPG